MSEAPDEKVVEIGPKFQLRPFDEIAVGSERAYLVKGLIPRAGLVVVWGPPKCGKSFWTFDLAMHVALGWEYRGRRVQQGSVVYLALEGGKGFGGLPPGSRCHSQRFRLRRHRGASLWDRRHAAPRPYQLGRRGRRPDRGEARPHGQHRCHRRAHEGRPRGRDLDEQT